MSSADDANPVVDIPFPQPGELSTEELVETMTDKEMKALIVNIYRAQLEILSFVRDVKDGLGGMAQNGGMMGKMVAGMMPESMKAGLVMPGQMPPGGGIHPNYPPKRNR